MKKLLLMAAAIMTYLNTSAQDWSGIAVPANAGSGNTWELQDNVSDDFNYTFNPVNSKTNFGDGKWYNFYHNAWDGPGTTYWKYQNVSVQNGSLFINASRWDQNNQAAPWNGNSPKMGLLNNGVNSGCVTSNARVQYPVYVESAISVANISLASCFWLLSPDDTQEIDIIENYGGVNGFKHLTHISHHSFIRSPFHDYQPRDWNSWWPDSRVSTSYGWGDWAWNNGNRRYLRLGVYWKTPNHFEYYIDGELVRVMYHNSIATLMNGTWEYTYYNSQHPANTVDSWGNNVGGMPVNGSNGYSEVTVYATSSVFNMNTLQAASDNSNGINVIDPGEYQNGNGFTKEMDIIINVESQSWLVSRNETPSDADLAAASKNTMEVDWVRVYKPVPSGGTVAVTGVTVTPTNMSLETGAQGNLTGQVSPINATDQTMLFTSNNINVATVNQSGVVTAVSEGTAVITATTTDGGYTATSTVTVSNSTTPPVQGESFEVEAESFNTTGGTFNDGQVPFGMNIMSGGVNYVNAGDWTEYTINASGTYTLEYMISTPMTSGTQVSLLVDGVTVNTTNVPNNGSWSNFTSLSASGNITLSGNHTLRVLASGSNDWQWNLDKLIFTAVEDVTPPPTTPSNFTIEAEDFGTTGGSFNDAFVPYGANKMNGVGINYVNSGDWTEYSVNVQNAGNYAIEYMISTPVNSGTGIQLAVDGTVVATDGVPSNGSWDNYQALSSSSSVNLSAGLHTFRITASGSNDWQWNLDKINFSSGSNARQIVASLESNFQEIIAYPIPSSGVVYLEGLEIGQYNIEVYSLNGETVYKSTIDFNYKHQLDLSTLSKGIYLISINGETRTDRIKVVLTN
ncbi:carbohydrate-binding protein [Flammeovirga sp. EKP202]|uniref:carbohydrate-binding protein n=1 Tax=Flammeovirga sp. EKP202 TaxID=2770592 RepID=UPI00165F6EF3|nr:carbohydrate-binding protein [Flammeovirga sp. EKP202]MBD0401359.1 carbohydrate-binding protein [Flammeovirga sp. EKP202]